MSKSYGDGCSAALVDEREPGQSSSSCLFSEECDNQFYLENFDI